MKKETIKPKTIKTTTPKLISFTMKAVIATGQYENIQPEITIEAETLEQAHDIIMPYIKSLHNQFSVNAPKPAPTPAPMKPQQAPQPAPTAEVVPEVTVETTEALSEPAMVAINATKATNDPVVLAQLKAKILASTKIPQNEIEYIIKTYFS